MIPERWEYGSDFHSCLRGPTKSANLPWSNHPHSLWSTGRDALYALLTHGRSTQLIDRLWCPTYFCQSVVEVISRTGLSVRLYKDDPTLARPNLQIGGIGTKDAVLTIGYFGLRKPLSHDHLPAGTLLIEDHSHDLLSSWSRLSSAHFCLASIRKTVPVPDGAVLWSPRGMPVPQPSDLADARQAAIFKRLAAMLLKSEYLAGASISKEVYRDLAVSGEDAFRLTTASTMSAYSQSMLGCFDFESARLARVENFRRFKQQLAKTPHLDLLPQLDEGAAPFTVMLLFDTGARRDSVRKLLIMRRIYPAVLWPLEHSPVGDLPSEQIELSRRLMCLPCDDRYSTKDVDAVCRAVSEIVAASEGAPAESAQAEGRPVSA